MLPYMYIRQQLINLPRRLSRVHGTRDHGPHVAQKHQPGERLQKSARELEAVRRRWRRLRFLRRCRAAPHFSAGGPRHVAEGRQAAQLRALWEAGLQGGRPTDQTSGLLLRTGLGHRI